MYVSRINTQESSNRQGINFSELTTSHICWYAEILRRILPKFINSFGTHRSGPNLKTRLKSAI